MIWVSKLAVKKTLLQDGILRIWGSQVVKNLPTSAGDAGDMGRSLAQEDPLEKQMAIHSSTLAWEILWTEEPGGLQSQGSQRAGHTWATGHTHNMDLIWENDKEGEKRVLSVGHFLIVSNENPTNINLK